jgi:hypothetical protein
MPPVSRRTPEDQFLKEAGQEKRRRGEQDQEHHALPMLLISVADSFLQRGAEPLIPGI